MMEELMSFNTKLINLLKTDPRFVDDEGELVIAAVQDRAWRIDRDLVKLLLSDKEIKTKFFEEIQGHWIFNTNTFIDYISQKNFLDNSYTRFRNRIGLTIGDQYLRERGDVALVWPYKDTVLEGGQTKEEEKRKEIFFNEVLAQDEINRLLDPKVLTNFARYTVKGKQKVTDFKRDENGVIRENLIIKGNNLLALHTLKTQFRGHVKLIYIDPPYNTEGDSNTFGYNNSFNHSTLLTFMKNRIDIAKELLRPDGVLAIAIDDQEQAYLKVLCDDIFHRDNHLGTLVVQTKPSGRTTDAYFATSHEYVLFYAKEAGVPEINFFELPEEQRDLYKQGEGEDAFKWRDFLRTGGYSTPQERPNSYYPIYFNPKTNHISLKRENSSYVEILPLDSTRNKRVWRKTPSSFLQHLERGEIKISRNKKGGWKVQIIDRIKRGVRPKSVWVGSKYDASSHGTKLLKEMFHGEKVFSYPKSINAVKDVIDIFTAREGDDIVLDFFAGSGTTAHAILNLNDEDGGARQFVLCEQMDYADSTTAERVRKVIKENKSGEFVYCELMQYNEVFMDRIQAAKSSKELVTVWREMAEGSFLNWYINPTLPEEGIRDFEALGKEENGLEKQKRLLAELLDKNQLYVNLSEIDDAQFKVSKDDEVLNRAFYGEAYNA
jgi:adenine-specific DNA-methyltransferase